MGKKLEKIYEFGKTHIVDSTGLLAVTNPIFATFENVFLGMSDEVSLNARLFATGITYAGMGSLFSRGRDLSRKLFNVKDTSKEGIQFVHDTGYAVALNAIVSPIMYATAGADSDEILKGTITAMAMSPLIGYVSGYAIDCFRDLTGIEKSERIPKKITNLTSKKKKGLAGLLVAGLVAANYGIYEATPDKQLSSNEGIIENRLDA